MTRELLWHGFAEFVFFLLPLINIHKLKNLIVRRFSSPASLVKQPSIKVACHECGICNEPPTAPHQGQCGHVFCYYCIKANSLADPSFPCPLCGAAVGDEITPVECTVALEVTWKCQDHLEGRSFMKSTSYDRFVEWHSSCQAPPDVFVGWISNCRGSDVSLNQSVTSWM